MRWSVCSGNTLKVSGMGSQRTVERSVMPRDLRAAITRGSFLTTSLIVLSSVCEIGGWTPGTSFQNSALRPGMSTLHLYSYLPSLEFRRSIPQCLWSIYLLTISQQGSQLSANLKVCELHLIL